MRPASPDLSGLSDACAAGLLLAIDPQPFGGIVVRGPAGPARDAYLAWLRGLLPPGTPWRRLPAAAADDHIEGGLDLTATLASGKPVTMPGLLAECDGGLIVLPMAERMSVARAARLGSGLDLGRTAREGRPARFGMVALDEGIEGESLPPGLADRLAFHVETPMMAPGEPWPEAADVVVQARALAPDVVVGEDVHRALAATAVALGVESLRPAIAALRAARMVAALAGCREVSPDHAGMAARLVLAPRATQWPGAQEPAPAEANPSSADQPRPETEPEGHEQAAGGTDEILAEAIRAALPSGLLLGLKAEGRTARQAPGRAGALQAAPNHGRPAGVRRGVPRGGARLNLIETLRAAAPWQRLRQSLLVPTGDPRRVAIRRDDLRLTRFKQRTETVTLFAIDASGSLALQRLNEAKGAVELLLAECYIRRDQVALLAFRGSGADLLLPPTRSLARAKRSLADLAGGGPTPLATALDAAARLTDGIRRRGRTPLLVLFTDARANVTRDGIVDRARAQAEAQDAARALAGSRLRILLIDAASRSQPAARDLATAMNATYLPLPRAEAAGLARAVRQAAAE